MKTKKILSLILSISIMMPGVVYAKENKNVQAKPENQKVVEQKATKTEKAPEKPDAAKAGQDQKQEAQQKKDEKKEQIETFKTDMKAKHEQMKSLREETIALRKQVEKKTTELSSILNDLQSGKKTLSEEMLNSLIAAAQNIKADGEEVKETAEISTEAKNTEAKVKGADFNNALASMDKVIAKYQKRLDSLTKLNADLDKALAVAKLSVAPAPADTSATTTSQSEQTAK